MTHPTATHSDTQYHFNTTKTSFFKFPSSLRRAAIMDALWSMSSCKSNFANWEKSLRGKAPSLPKISHTCSALYKDNMYVHMSDYSAKVKVWHNNDWIWFPVSFRKSDVDYITHHLQSAKETVKMSTIYSCCGLWHCMASTKSVGIRRLIFG